MQFKFAGTIWALYAGGRPELSKVPGAYLYGWCKLFLRELNKLPWVPEAILRFERVLPLVPRV